MIYVDIYVFLASTLQFRVAIGKSVKFFNMLLSNTYYPSMPYDFCFKESV